MTEPKPFTDEDLNYWKQWIADPNCGDHGLSVRQANNLLARLEAAEKVIKTFDCAYKFVDTDICKCEEMHNEALEAWRKTVGKK